MVDEGKGVYLIDSRKKRKKRRAWVRLIAFAGKAYRLKKQKKRRAWESGRLTLLNHQTLFVSLEINIYTVSES